MSADWNDELFKKWLQLRTDLRKSKKNKNWAGVIKSCNHIIQLDLDAKFIGIVIPLFYKEMASSYTKMGENANALKSYLRAKDEFIKYRINNALKNPSDWLSDISAIDKHIVKLQAKENK